MTLLIQSMIEEMFKYSHLLTSCKLQQYNYIFTKNNKIISDYSVYLNKKGFFLFEIGYDQAESLHQISKKYGLMRLSKG